MWAFAKAALDSYDQTMQVRKFLPVLSRITAGFILVSFLLRFLVPYSIQDGSREFSFDYGDLLVVACCAIILMPLKMLHSPLLKWIAISAYVLFIVLSLQKTWVSVSDFLSGARSWHVVLFSGALICASVAPLANYLLDREDNPKAPGLSGEKFSLDLWKNEPSDAGNRSPDRCPVHHAKPN